MAKICIRGGLVILGLALLTTGIVFERDIRRWSRTPVDKSIAEAYVLHEFEPKYRRADCIVGIEQHNYPESRSSLERVPSAEISRYIFENEPRAILYSYRTQPRGYDQPMIFIQFSDQCERRFEIATGIADYINYWYPGVYNLNASEKVFNPGYDTIHSSGRGYWIDG